MMGSMLGFIAPTDEGWYRCLVSEPGPREANFWKPSIKPLPRSVIPGTPFIFKLKRPHWKVAGFGYFKGFWVLPDWLAWDTFGDGNGVESLEEMERRLAHLQSGARIEADAQRRIGCCLIEDARFFAESDWIDQPADWPRTLVNGMSYDLTNGEGLRVWTECQLRAAAMDQSAASPGHDKYGKPSLYLPRLGQGIFRIQVLDAYHWACAVTQERSLPVLEAAHILPYAGEGEHAVANGLCLRTDLHRLFDRGYATVDEAHRFVISKQLKLDFDNGHSYDPLHGQQLVLPQDPELRPDPHALAWHRENRFRG